MADARRALTSLLEEAGRAHHEAFRHVDGHDPHWPEWYAAYIEPRIGAITDEVPHRAELADMLTMADVRYREARSDLSWPAFYAELLVAALGSNADGVD